MSMKQQYGDVRFFPHIYSSFAFVFIWFVSTNIFWKPEHFFHTYNMVYEVVLYAISIQNQNVLWTTTHALKQIQKYSVHHVLSVKKCFGFQKIFFYSNQMKKKEIKKKNIEKKMNITDGEKWSSVFPVKIRHSSHWTIEHPYLNAVFLVHIVQHSSMLYVCILCIWNVVVVVVVSFCCFILTVVK